MSRPRYEDIPELEQFQDALDRGYDDPAFFSHYFLRRKLTDKQAQWMREAEATYNIAATANRFGKTSILTPRHYYRNVYKFGGEQFYTNPVTGDTVPELFLRTKYQTIHTAGQWDTASLVWVDALKVYEESQRLRQFIKATPRTLPPHIDFVNGARWKFRTLGDHGEGIDGNSFYYISIDEAGWIRNLKEILSNVGEVRVADVDGVIDIVGTFKPGISQDFAEYAVEASGATGVGISFEFDAEKSYVDYFREAGYDENLEPIK